jgi:peptidoglycan hydrolase CwlO-like protein
MVKKCLFLIVLSFFYLFSNGAIQAKCDNGKCDTPEEYPAYAVYLAKTAQDLHNSAKTLSNEIKILDIQTFQTQLKISQTEQSITTLQQEIASLTDQIGKLDISLNDLTAVYIKQVNQNYRLNKKVPFLSILLSGNFNFFFEQYKYLSRIQGSIQNTLLEMETTRTNMDSQKQIKSEKQKELTKLEANLQNQRKDLNNQKTAKLTLLAVTKNDEARYQSMLKQAQDELEAIERILVGSGSEEEVRQVSKGEKIASVIQGASCSSSGTHLHFMVKTGNIAQNPFSQLKSGVSYQDNSNGDAFNPSGSWDWPIKEKIDFNQGYGKTWSISHTWVGRIYSFHNGIDIASNSSPEVYSSHSGKLYRGKINAGSCTLKYVRVQDSSNQDLSTLYLHVNYF